MKMSSSAKVEETIKKLSEPEFKTWLTENAFDVVEKVGVRKGQTVLDYGCGSGTFAIPSAKIVGEEGKVYAFEICLDALEHVKEKAKDEGLGNIETILSDSSKLTTGLQDGGVDAVLVYDVMHVIDDRQRLLKELHRVLRRDGFLSIFPMHVGTDKMLEITNECGLFCLRDRYGPPEYKTASEVLNFNKCQLERR